MLDGRRQETYDIFTMATQAAPGGGRGRRKQAKPQRKGKTRKMTRICRNLGRCQIKTCLARAGIPLTLPFDVFSRTCVMLGAIFVKGGGVFVYMCARPNRQLLFFFVSVHPVFILKSRYIVWVYIRMWLLYFIRFCRFAARRMRLELSDFSLRMFYLSFMNDCKYIHDKQIL